MLVYEFQRKVTESEKNLVEEIQQAHKKGNTKSRKSDCETYFDESDEDNYEAPGFGPAGDLHEMSFSGEATAEDALRTTTDDPFATIMIKTESQADMEVIQPVLSATDGTLRPPIIDKFTLGSSMKQERKRIAHVIEMYLTATVNEDNVTVRTCKQCNASFNTKTPAYQHVRYVHLRDKTNLYFCDLCHFSSPRKFNLQLHIERHLAKLKHKQSLPEKPKESPPINSKSIKEDEAIIVDGRPKDGVDRMRLNETLVKHVEKTWVDDFQRYVCTICRKDFVEKSSVVVHLKNTHFKDRQKMFHCRECEYSTARTSNFKRHTLTHHFKLRKPRKKRSKSKQETE